MRWQVVDTEGADGRPVAVIVSPSVLCDGGRPLGTDCVLTFLMQASIRHATRIGFSLTYDLNVWLWEWPLDVVAQLSKRPVVYRGWRVEWIPRHRITVSRAGHSTTIWDVWGFYQSSLLEAARTWGVSVPDVVRAGKASRGSFAQWDATSIVRYLRAEAEVLEMLVARTASSFQEVGLSVRSWGGPGGAAGAWLASHAADAVMQTDAPSDVWDAASYAYFGGRIDQALWGWTGPVWQYDLQSAYPAVMRKLPDLSRLQWRRGIGEGWRQVPDGFALVHVRWMLRRSRNRWQQMRWHPLPWRTVRGRVLWPSDGEGWYWAVEAHQAACWPALEEFDVLEWWAPTGQWRYPLRASIDELAACRLELKRREHPAHRAIKLVLNSLYGKFAQRASRRRSGPRWRNRLWAGYVTAAVRAQLAEVLRHHGDQVVMVLTDSLLATEPLPLDCGETLGTWTVCPWSRAGLVAPGIAMYERPDGSMSQQRRGFAAAVPVAEILDQWTEQAPRALTSLRSDASVQDALARFTVRIPVRLFVTASLSHHQPASYGDHWRQFLTIERCVHPTWLVGTTKRLGGLRVLPPRERREAKEVNGHLLSCPYDVDERYEDDVLLEAVHVGDGE